MRRVYRCKDCLIKEDGCMNGCSNYELKPFGYKLKQGERTYKSYDCEDIKKERFELMRNILINLLKESTYEQFNVNTRYMQESGKKDSLQIDINCKDTTGEWILNSFVHKLLEKEGGKP